MTASRIVAVVAAAALLVGAGAGAYLLIQNSRYSSRQNEPIGTGVTVTGAKVPSDMQARAIKTAAPAFLDMQRLGPVMEVTPGGTLPAPVTLRFKLGRQVKPGDVVMLATSEAQGATWTMQPAKISSDGWYAAIETSHLSWWTPYWFDVTSAINEFKKQIIDAVSSDVIATADKPHCDNETQARQDNYSITSSAKDTLYWCFGVESGERVLKSSIGCAIRWRSGIPASR